jgi:fluoroquinolone transport system ATP-binding protein
MGMLRTYGGQISVMGRDRRDWGPDFYERVGVSFELPNHYLKLTARENLRYFRRLYAGDTRTPDDALALVGLLPDGDKRVSEFSKGMKARLNLARSLLHYPKLLFLDEPTSGLDPVNSAMVRDLIRTLRDEGATVFLTTHDMAVADALCDRVAFIVDGSIRLVDSPRALKLRYGRRMVRVEFGANGNRDSREFALDGLGDNVDFVALLRGGPVETIHTQETTLEQVFIDLTGRALA